MSSVAAAKQPLARPAGGSQQSILANAWVVILLGFVMSLAMSWPRLVEVWQQGTYFDTDDAMRLVQIRNWLGGQGWFDLVEHRLGPAPGMLAHWSRVVDVPVAGLIRLFGLFASVETSERLARIVFPLGLQLGLVAVTVHLGRLLVGVQATLPAMILVVLSGFAYEQFPAGRIDHHAPQITLLVAMTATILAALSPATAWRAFLTGLCMAVSLAISLENLPFIAVIVAVLPCAWIVDPALVRRALLWFGLGLAVCIPLLFAATTPPSRYLDGVCDAFSIAHLIAGMAGAAGMVVLSLLSTRLPNRLHRVLAVGVVGGLVGGFVLLKYPACLQGPYASLDPELKRLWLAHATEAQPLLLAARERHDTITILLCPLLAGCFGTLAAVWFETGVSRIRWIAMLGLTLAGIAGTFWEIRVSSSTQPLALMGGVWVAAGAMDLARRRSAAIWSVLAACTLLPFATLAWAFVPTGDKGGPAAEVDTRTGCRTTHALGPLDALGTGMVFSPIDDGSHLLAYTRLSVLGAPYHRDQSGMLAVLHGFMAQPRAAEAIVRAAGARYVMLCPGEVQISVMTKAAPEGLGSMLAAGQVPDWLRPVAVAGTPYRVFEVR